MAWSVVPAISTEQLSAQVVSKGRLCLVNKQAGLSALKRAPSALKYGHTLYYNLPAVTTEKAVIKTFCFTRPWPALGRVGLGPRRALGRLGRGLSAAPR